MNVTVQICFRFYIIVAQYKFIVSRKRELAQFNDYLRYKGDFFPKPEKFLTVELPHKDVIYSFTSAHHKGYVWFNTEISLEKQHHLAFKCWSLEQFDRWRTGFNFSVVEHPRKKYKRLNRQTCQIISNHLEINLVGKVFASNVIVSPSGSHVASSCWEHNPLRSIFCY